MFIAQKKKQENIIEYVLYMWQIEDLIRSCNFNIETINETVITKSPYSELEKQKLKDWYIDLMLQLERENKQQSGHIQELDDIITELEKVHDFFIKIKQNETYYKLYIKTLPLIEELKKDNHYTPSSDIRVCIEFIYGYLLLRLQEKTVSQSTTDALRMISIYCYELADKYNDYKQGYLTISHAQKN